MAEDQNLIICTNWHEVFEAVRNRLPWMIRVDHLSEDDFREAISWCYENLGPPLLADIKRRQTTSVDYLINPQANWATWSAQFRFHTEDQAFRFKMHFG
jgi:hypothetical protein